MSLDDIMTSILKKLLQKRLLTMRTSEIFFQKLININFELTSVSDTWVGYTWVDF